MSYIAHHLGMNIAFFHKQGSRTRTRIIEGPAKRGTGSPSSKKTWRDDDGIHPIVFGQTFLLCFVGLGERWVVVCRGGPLVSRFSRVGNTSGSLPVKGIDQGKHLK